MESARLGGVVEEGACGREANELLGTRRAAVDLSPYIIDDRYRPSLRGLDSDAFVAWLDICLASMTHVFSGELRGLPPSALIFECKFKVALVRFHPSAQAAA